MTGGPTYTGAGAYTPTSVAQPASSTKPKQKGNSFFILYRVMDS